MASLHTYTKFFAVISTVVLTSMSMSTARSETINGTAFFQANEHVISDIIASQEISGSRIAVIGNLVEKIDAFTVENNMSAEKIVQASLNDESGENKVQSQEPPRAKPFIISSEAQLSCRIPGMVKNAPNFKRVTEHECLCELSKRSPAARNAGATEEDLHWFTQCKKARYTVSFFQAK